MKPKNFLSYLAISLIIFLLFNNYAFAQQYISQGDYFPPKSPNGVVRSTGDATSEDWWYDVKTIPSSHPAYSSGKFIGCGYSEFSDAGLGPGLYNNDACLKYTASSSISPDLCDFDLPDMKHAGMNITGTIGLFNLTNTTNSGNAYVWYYNYGLATVFTRVIPTSDSGFIATGNTAAMVTPGITSSEVQYGTHVNMPILYQSPSATVGNPNEIHAFNYYSSSCTVPKNPHDTVQIYPLLYRHTCVIKVNKDGILQWYYQYGTAPFSTSGDGTEAYVNSGIGSDIIEVSGGYLIAGVNKDYYLSGGNQGNHGFLAKIDYNGMLLWIKQYGNTSPYVSSRFEKIISSSSNGNYLYVADERVRNTAGTKYPSILGGICSVYPNGTLCWDGNNNAEIDGPGLTYAEPFIRKIDLTTQNQLWELPLATETSPQNFNHKVRDLSIDVNNHILATMMTNCTAINAQAECLTSVVDKIADNTTSASVTQTINFGAIRAYDLRKGMAISATTDGGFVLVATKKAYDLPIYKDYSAPPYSHGYNLSISNCGNEDAPFTQTDAFVAKYNSAGNAEWTTIFDNKAPSPGLPSGDISTTAGNPRIQSNLDSWMNHTTGTDPRSKADIKRQECLYTISTTLDGNIIVSGNQSSNIDDSYSALVQNTCTLNLTDNIIQAIPVWQSSPTTYVTQMNNFIATTINTGRYPGNTDQVASFAINNNASGVLMEAGYEINMYESTDIDAGTQVDADINPTNTCTSGPIYKQNSQFRSTADPTSFDESSKIISSNNEKAAIYPNPTNGVFQLNFSLPSPEIVSAEILDLTGRKVATLMNHAELPASQVNKTFDISNLPANIYLCKVTIGNKTKLFKISKQ